VRLDSSAFLAVLLASTGLTQTEAAALLQVDGRTVRRWLEGTRPTPKVAIERLRAWAYALDQTAEGIIMRKGVPAVLLLYRRDRDVPSWTGLRTAGCHLALVRRVFERRPDIQLITFDPVAYRWWRRDRTDSEDMRAAWAASRV
jgi:transcriptional regulator with XRE-family HTH domain